MVTDQQLREHAQESLRRHMTEARNSYPGRTMSSRLIVEEIQGWAWAIFNSIPKDKRREMVWGEQKEG